MKKILIKLSSCFTKNKPVYFSDNISICSNPSEQNIHINTVVNMSNKHYKAYLDQISNSTSDLSNLLNSYLSN